jgi:hypothetical protein
MNLLNTYPWQSAVAATLVVALIAVGVWLLVHKRPTAEELERARRQFLVQSGRLVDGMLLDVREIKAPVINKGKNKGEAWRTLTLLFFNYRIGGVDYECSQDITDMQGVTEAARMRAGFPCTVRYQPGNPQNSIVVAEDWTGMRASLPVPHAYDDPEPIDLSHLRPGHS